MPPPSTPRAVLVGARAILIRGPAGAGKSRLALELIQAAARTAGLRAAGRRRSRSRRGGPRAADRPGARQPRRAFWRCAASAFAACPTSRWPWCSWWSTSRRRRRAHAGRRCRRDRDRRRAAAASCGRTGRGCRFACARRPHIGQVSPGKVCARQFFGRAILDPERRRRQPRDARGISCGASQA